jgi:hypothetical protein
MVFGGDLILIGAGSPTGVLRPFVTDCPLTKPPSTVVILGGCLYLILGVEIGDWAAVFCILKDDGLNGGGLGLLTLGIVCVVSVLGTDLMIGLEILWTESRLTRGWRGDNSPLLLTGILLINCISLGVGKDSSIFL